MKLRDLLKSIDYKSPDSDIDDIEIEGIACDSRVIKKGYLFIAIPGTKLDGHKFVSEAIERGAVAVVVEKDVALADGLLRQGYEGLSTEALAKVDGIPKIYVGDAREALAKIADEFYCRPSKKIKCIGITGTNGKTTISYLIDSVLSASGHKAGIVGTINYRIGQRVIPATNTTPGPIELHNFMNEMVQNSIDYAVLEVSSHSLDQRRVEGIKFLVAIFTNLTGEHLDYHRTLDEYFNAKAKLFEGLDRDSHAVINLDDEWGIKLLKRSKGKITAYGIKSDAQFRASKIDLSLSGAKFAVDTPRGRLDVNTRLIGLHNVYNITASIAASFCLEFPLDSIKRGVENLISVPGRLEPIDCGQPFKVFVDYAHTDDALYNVLSTLKPLISKKIIIVFGCGGERDRTKRPRMGRVASRLADFVIVTSDNPRGEEPQTIAQEIVAGIETKDYLVMLNREEAIEEALSKAKEGDCVLIAGKGHETYQVLKNTTIALDDREITRKILCSK